MNDGLTECRLYWQASDCSRFGVWSTYVSDAGDMVAFCGQEPPADHNVIDENVYLELCVDLVRETKQRYYEQQIANEDRLRVLQVKRATNIERLVQTGIDRDLAEQMINEVTIPRQAPFDVVMENFAPQIAGAYQLSESAAQILLEEARA